jgi:hypothetical protein
VPEWTWEWLACRGCEGRRKIRASVIEDHVLGPHSRQNILVGSRDGRVIYPCSAHVLKTRTCVYAV